MELALGRQGLQPSLVAWCPVTRDSEVTPVATEPPAAGDGTRSPWGRFHALEGTLKMSAREWQQVLVTDVTIDIF